MTSQQPIEPKSAAPLDSVLLVLSFAVLAGGIVAFYWFATLPIAVRFAMVLGSLGVACALAYQTQPGKTMWSYIRGSQVELRKTTWPTRQESLQATLMIAVVVLVVSVFLWILDSGLLWAVKQVTGRG